ncbi:MAG: hypothetical protein RIQ94_1395 [Pseudomonadota bacterium]|jgi:sigma-B regulation protein RsbU (phosphoserine phosphatase)
MFLFKRGNKDARNLTLLKKKQSSVTEQFVPVDKAGESINHLPHTSPDDLGSKQEKSDPALYNPKKSIRWKLLTTMIGLLICLIVILSSLEVVLQKKLLEKELSERIDLMKASLVERGYSMSNLMLSQVENDVAAFNFSRITENLKNATEESPSLVYGILMNNDGLVIIHSSHPELQEEVLIDEPSKFALAQHVLTYREEPGINITEFILPIHFGKQQWGVLRLGFTTEELQKEIAHSKEAIVETIRNVIISSSLIAVFFVIVGSIVVLFISNTLSRPLIRLTEAAKEMARGNFEKATEMLDEKVSGINTQPFKAEGEIGILAHSFIEMASDIQHSIQERILQQSYQETLKLSQSIQMGMLSTDFPRFSQGSVIDLFAYIQPAREVGGDFYDFFKLNDKTLLLAVADVSGKGVPAALYMVRVKTLVRAMANQHVFPHDMMAALNPELCRDNDAMMFVTVFLATLDLETNLLTYSYGGHNQPLYISSEGNVSMLEGDSGTALGIFEEATFTMETLQLNPGDSILLYTDGINEAMNVNYEEYGDDRFCDLFRGTVNKNAQDLVEMISADVAIFTKGAEQSDDITLLALKIQS